MTHGTTRTRGVRDLITALFVLLLSVPAAAGTVTLTWSPNPETDVAGYIVYWGTAPGQYTSTVDVGRNLAYQFVEPNPYVRYYFAVAAYNVAGGRSDLSVEVATDPLPPPLALTSLASNVAPPQLAGSTITFTANAAGGVAPYEYKWLLSTGSGWTVAKTWSTSNTFAWTPASANANYQIGVWVRSAGSIADAPETANAGSSMAFPITAAAPTPAPTPTPVTVSVTSVTANKASPQTVGSKINFTATATGASSYQFKWWVFNGTAWAIAQEWSTSAKLMWTAPAAGDYQVLVRVRASANTAESSGVSMPYAVESSVPKGNGR